MSYIYCDACGIGFHSNVHSCPECGRPASRTYDLGVRAPRRIRPGALREDVENEVREAIYGWRSGTVELRDDAAPPMLVGVVEPVQRGAAPGVLATRSRAPGAGL